MHWSREGNGKPFPYSCLENAMNSMKRQKDRTLKDELPRSAGAQHAMGDQWRNNPRKNEETELEQTQHPAVDGLAAEVNCDAVRATWGARSMKQGKLEAVKQEMARVNINVLGISEPKWTGMGDSNSDGHYIYYCGQESLRRNGITITVNKSPNCSTWIQFQKWQNSLCLFRRQTIHYHSMSRPVILKKLKLNGSMKTYKTF